MIKISGNAGRPAKYKTAKSLTEKITEYFSSISRTVEAYEKIPTGRYDDKGHEIFESVPIFGDNGEPIIVTEYVIPPTVGKLCKHINIHRSTWAEYCNTDIHPEFADITDWARNEMQSYLEEELLTRAKNIQGIIFQLQNNYGWHDKKEVELGRGAVQALTIERMTLTEKQELLREMADQYRTDMNPAEEDEDDDGADG